MTTRERACQIDAIAEDMRRLARDVADCYQMATAFKVTERGRALSEKLLTASQELNDLAPVIRQLDKPTEFDAAIQQALDAFHETYREIQRVIQDSAYG